MTIRNAFGTEPPFDPGACLPFVAPTPLLMVVASEDRVAPTADALAAYGRAHQPKRLLVLDGHHFEPYAGEGLARASEAATALFTDHLA